MSDVTLLPTLCKRLVLCCALVLISHNAYTDTGTILVYGDSISAAYGMEEAEGWAALLEQRIEQQELPYKVVNASVSGETTGGGLVRLPKTLEIHQPDVVILELGGNDGLRGYPIDRIEENLDAMTRMALEAGAEVLLVGMVLPPNYGRRYIEAFTNVFPAVAETHDVELLPFILDGIATPESLVQRDGIHPKPEAQPLILDQVWGKLTAMLGAADASQTAASSMKSEEVELKGRIVGDQ